MAMKTSKRRAQNLSTALFLIGLAIVAFTGSWWPNIMLVLGLPMALRQYLTGRSHEMMTTLFVFVGVWVTFSFPINWKVLLPVIFLIAAVYILFREFLDNRAQTEVEKDEDINVEIEIEEYRNER